MVSVVRGARSVEVEGAGSESIEVGPGSVGVSEGVVCGSVMVM